MVDPMNGRANCSSTNGNGGVSSAPRSTAIRKRAVPLAVPEAVAWLDFLTLELAATSTSGKTQYHLTMRYKPSHPKLAPCATTWTLSRSFDEYRAFHKRLSKRLQHGHSCGADCKWLHKVVKHYFPQKSLFSNNCPKVVAARQQTLIRFLTTVQTSLMNRGNHSCQVLVSDVGAEFNRFVVKGMKDLKTSAATSDLSEFSAATRDSFDSLDLEDGDEHYESEDEAAVEESECDACHSRHVMCRTHRNQAAKCKA
uniref:PX domain-containing protein n=1 Tax=Peronospora matthiolae TaxID=2874970 RepID=A0AAV1VHI0_9STRA